MNIDIKKTSKILSDLRKSKDIETYIELFQKKFCTEIKYTDYKKNKLSNDLIKNPNYINLIKYTQDAETVIYCSIREIDEFIDAIKDTETDIYTYLDNFIYDDTKHKTVNDYILKDFKKVEKFALYLLKGYFLHNFEEYLNKLQ